MLAHSERPLLRLRALPPLAVHATDVLQPRDTRGGTRARKWLLPLPAAAPQHGSSKRRAAAGGAPPCVVPEWPLAYAATVMSRAKAPRAMAEWRYQSSEGMVLPSHHAICSDRCGRQAGGARGKGWGGPGRLQSRRAKTKP
jgi:hypothetical protein